MSNTDDMQDPKPRSAATRARRRRMAFGAHTENLAREQTDRLSLQGMLQYPLLQVLEEMGGRARPGELYEQLAERLDVPEDLRRETRACGDGSRYAVFPQQVRWARQSLVMQGFILSGTRGIWELADSGYAKLQRARRGVTVLVYSLDDGVALWAHAEDAATVIARDSVSLILTSPPYPNKTRDYGRLDVPEWLSWMKRLTAMWRDLLAEDGTLAINIGDVFVPGQPVLSPYVERYVLSAVDECGLHLAGRLPWVSPTKLGNIQWTSRAKVQPKNVIEHVLLFSRSPNPGWDITRLPPVPYSPATLSWWERTKVKRNAQRPGGYNINDEAFAPKGDGALPSNLIVAAGAPGMDTYSRRCRAAGIPVHGARFPAAVPRTVILLCTDKGQTVYDPMSGSNKTGRIARDLGRRFIASDCMLTSVRGSAFRFDREPDFTMHPLPVGVF